MRHSSHHFATRLALAVAIGTALVATAVAPVAAAETEMQRVTSVAKAQLGDPWVFGATGPDTFDCSGFVYYAFKRADVLDRIGGSRRTARGYWDWFADRGDTSRSNGRRGDLVVWGSGRHIGIYLGDGRAISALTSGVQKHGLHDLTLPFTTFLHVRLERG
jgi:cell wall-associated NlpC family hydrolase